MFPSQQSKSFKWFECNPRASDSNSKSIVPSFIRRVPYSISISLHTTGKSSSLGALSAKSHIKVSLQLSAGELYKSKLLL
uniref:Uncharacterized protein n=1 Tax=Medicago truncatula TaxID=3880 RepID=I3SUE8_MEDTR|nr:unknown [Medicago truncatula]